MPVEQPAFNTIQYDYNAIKYQGPQFWNTLDNQMKRCKSLKEFKARLDDGSRIATVIIVNIVC